MAVRHDSFPVFAPFFIFRGSILAHHTRVGEKLGVCVCEWEAEGAYSRASKHMLQRETNSVIPFVCPHVVRRVQRVQQPCKLATGITRINRTSRVHNNVWNNCSPADRDVEGRVPSVDIVEFPRTRGRAKLW